MDLSFVEYDDSGEIFHVCTVSTAEGNISPPPNNASKEVKAAHADAIKRAIAEKHAATKTQLQEHRKAGKRLLLVPDGDPLPEYGRHYVDHAAGKIIRRTDEEFEAFVAAQQPVE